jgi:hypothetical protein
LTIRRDRVILSAGLAEDRLDKSKTHDTDDGRPRGEIELLRQTLSKLEERISTIEKRLNLDNGEFKKDVKPVVSPGAPQNADSLEMQVGLYWFAKVGVVLFIAGVTFLLTEPFENLPSMFAPVLGLVVAAVTISMSQIVRKSFPLLSGYLLGGGLVLSFVAGMRLHYFSFQPLLANGTVETGLLLAIGCASIGVSIRRASAYTAAVGISMLFVIGLLADNAGVFLCILMAASTMTVYLKLKRGWKGIMIFGMAGAFLSVLEWSLGNPLAGNPMKLRTPGDLIVVLLLTLLIVFACGNLLRGRDKPEDATVILSSLFNSGLGYSLFLFLVLTAQQRNPAAWNVLGFLVFLFLAATFWIHENSRFQTFVYAMTGYAALSFAIVAQFRVPDLFVWLCWQSFIVVSTAIWFRSKFIVVTNFIIYALTFVSYLVLAGTVSLISLSFGVVALLSARILNWQRHRLELRTEIMRNAYLASAFLIFPYALYQAIPSDYVGLSWIGMATVYYVISLILDNVKYRWMSLLTFLLSVVYLVVAGITKLDPFLRIVSFLVLGLALLLVSLIYLRAKVKSGSREV